MQKDLDVRVLPVVIHILLVYIDMGNVGYIFFLVSMVVCNTILILL